MKITITPGMLCSLIPSFTLEACEYICNYFENSNEAPSIGDIAISFSEIPHTWIDDEDGQQVLVTLNNGNALILN